MAKTRDQMEQTKRLMAALVRMPPKPHVEMKVGKKKRAATKPPASKAKDKPAKR